MTPRSVRCPELTKVFQKEGLQTSHSLGEP